MPSYCFEPLDSQKHENIPNPDKQEKAPNQKIEGFNI